MATGCNLPAVVTGLFFGQYEQLVLAPFASLGHLQHNPRPSKSGLTFPSPVKSMKLDTNRTMATNRVTLASIAATLGLMAWAAIGLQSQTAELLTACRQGPEPAACELRLLGR